MLMLQVGILVFWQAGVADLYLIVVVGIHVSRSGCSTEGRSPQIPSRWHNIGGWSQFFGGWFLVSVVPILGCCSLPKACKYARLVYK